MSTQDLDVNQYHLEFMAIRMKVKFPCKMKLQHSGNSITEDIAVNQHHKFVFNQEVTIKQQCQKQSFDINVVLTTEKGAKYVSGVLKLYHTELQKSLGDKIVCPLVKCLDNDAFCELKVNRVKSGKMAKRISVSSTLIDIKKNTSNFDKQSKNGEREIMSPRIKKKMDVETRSQIGLKEKRSQEWDDTRSKGPAQTLIYKQSFMKSPKNKNNFGLGLPKMMSDFNQEYDIGNSQKNGFSQTQVYKQGYQKLKQKYKKQSENAKTQANKRLQLQSNENNFKIQIMRLKLKTEEQQNIIVQKNQRINALQITISEINKKELDMEFLKEENANCEHKINNLNQSIQTLTKENTNLKRLSQERSKGEQQIVNELRRQLQAVKVRLQSTSMQSQQTIKQKVQRILSLQSDLKSKASTIQLQKNQIHKLESHLQHKLYDFEKTLQQEKNTGHSEINKLTQKIELLEREKQAVQNSLTDSKNEREKMKGLILKVEYDKKVLLQEQKAIKEELLQYKTLKQRHVQLSREVNFLQQDKVHLQKQLQSLNNSKTVNLNEITEQYEVKIDYYRKQMKGLEERVKTLSTSKIELESQIEVQQNSIDKTKRQTQAMAVDLTDQKNKVKELKTYSNSLQQQNLTLQNEISVSSNKMRFGEQTSRMEIEKYKDQLEKLKNELSSENLRNVQLFEAKSNLQIEVGKKKIELQYAQEKIEKLQSGNKQLQVNLEHMMKDSENQIADLKKSIEKHQQQAKSQNEKMHRYELDRIESSETIQNMKKDCKIYDEKVAYQQNQIKYRQEELHAANQQIRNLDKLNHKAQAELNALKHDVIVLKNEKAKNQKIIQIKDKDIESHKKEYTQLKEEKDSLELSLQEAREKAKKDNESYTKLEMKLKSSQREYKNFRELMAATIKNQYAKIPMLNSQKATTDVTARSNTEEVQNSVSLIHGQLMSNILDSKQTLFKLIEHNKQLKKEIEVITQQTEKESNKYQFTELELHRDIQQLEEDMHMLYEQKEEEIVNSDKLISELNCKLHEKDSLIDELNMQCEELEYALSTLKLDFETNNDQNDKKVEHLKLALQELQDKNEFYKTSLSNQEDTNHELEEKLAVLQSDKEQLNEQKLKLTALRQSLEEQKAKLQETIEEHVKNRKQMIEQQNELEICLNEQKDLRSKTNKLLEQQEARTAELKEFISTIIKQKEEMIKSELDKTDQILKLETLEIELKRDQEILAEELQRHKSELDATKEKLRSETASVNKLSAQLQELQSKAKKLEEKCVEKEREITLKDDVISSVNSKYKELAEKNYNDTIELHSQIDSKYNENITLNKQMTEKITVLEAQIEQLEHIKSKQHHDYIEQSNELLAGKEHIELLKREIASLKKEVQQLQQEEQSLEARVADMQEEIEQRQEANSALNDRIIVLQGELEAQCKDKNIKLEESHRSWSLTYENMLEEEEQKIAILEKEKGLIVGQLQEKIAELELSLIQFKNSQSGSIEIKKNYDEKLKNLEANRISSILQKNNEIKKLTEENKILSKSLKEVEANYRESSQLLEDLRKRIADEQKARKQAEEKFKSEKRVKESELAALSKKIADQSSYKEKIQQTLYSNQRQVRKVVHNYLKSIMDQCDNKHIDKITNASKSLEASVVAAMLDKVNE